MISSFRSLIYRALSPGLRRHTEWLEQELQRHRMILDKVSTDPTAAWLYRNRVERMDANETGIFDPLRTEFHLARYRFAMGQLAGSRIADIACGTGYGTALLAGSSQPGRLAIGIDIDPEAVAYATKRYGAENIIFKCADGCATGLPDGVHENVTSFETLEHVVNPDALLREFRRILTPNGRLIISIPNNWAVEDAPCYKPQINAAEFDRLLRCHFSYRKLWVQNSGSRSKYNHDQPAGIVPLDENNQDTAECIIAICHN